MDDSASIFCAREMRGTMSIATTVAPRSAASFSIASFWAGQKKEISVCPLVRRATSDSSGSRTLITTSTAADSASHPAAP
jgi:hypothetical protein